MKFEIKNRWSGEIQFEAEIECAVNARVGVKIGLAVKWAFRTGAVLTGAVLRGADLRDADLRGADLTGAVLRGAVLTGAVLTGADLRDADLTGADLTGAVLRGADLRDADLTGAVLTGAVLRGAVLRGAVLTGAVLRGAVLRGVPKIENIDAKILAAIEANKAAGTNGLKMSNWHGEDCDETNWCNTTHCRAGYAICIAGKAGFDLERKVGAHVAGILIYRESRPGQGIPNFFASDKDAMADIRKCAAEQTAEK